MALDELKSKDFAYVHVELPDQVVYDPDVKAKVRAIEEVDAEFVGPFLAGMTALGPYRLVTVSDPGSVHQGTWRKRTGRMPIRTYGETVRFRPTVHRGGCEGGRPLRGCDEVCCAALRQRLVTWH